MGASPPPLPVDPDDVPTRPFAVQPTSRPRRSTATEQYPLGDTELLVQLRGRSALHTLNASAWAVWELCDGSRSIAEIARELSPDAQRPADVLVADVTLVVQRLGALGLLDAD